MYSVFITGCNRGIGLEFIRQLLARPDLPKHIFATCRNPSQACELNELKEKHSARLHVLQLDVVDYARYGDVVKYVENVVGDEGLTVLLNNAGVSEKGVAFGALKPENMKNVYEINAIAPLMLAQAFHPLLKKAVSRCPGESMSCNRAAILNMSSLKGSLSDNMSGGSYAYRCSKAALNMLTVSESLDLKQDGILCATLHPGWVKTDMGGPNAITPKEECVQGLLNIMESLDANKNGGFFNFKGNQIPW